MKMSRKSHNYSGIAFIQGNSAGSLKLIEQTNTSKICYEPHGHAITGNLMVIENIKLKDQSTKNPLRSTGSQQKLWF